MFKGYKASKAAAFSDYNSCEVLYAVGTVSGCNRYKATHAVVTVSDYGSYKATRAAAIG